MQGELCFLQTRLKFRVLSRFPLRSYIKGMISNGLPFRCNSFQPIFILYSNKHLSQISLERNCKIVKFLSLRIQSNLSLSPPKSFVPNSDPRHTDYRFIRGRGVHRCRLPPPRISSNFGRRSFPRIKESWGEFSSRDCCCSRTVSPPPPPPLNPRPEEVSRRTAASGGGGGGA